MDGKGRYIDNIFVERLWRSVKYEEVYLKAYQNVPEARAGIGAYLRFYNHERPHQALGYQTPQEIFEEGQGWRCLHEQGLALPSNLETTSPVMVPTKPAEDSLSLALSLSKQWGPLQQAIVLDAVDNQLTHQPTVETRNRKPMRPNPVAPWELRVGNLRVYYDVEEEPESLVYIRAVGIKQRNRVRIGREVIEI